MFRCQLALFVYSPIVLFALTEAGNQLVLKHFLLLFIKVNIKVSKGLSIYSIFALYFTCFFLNKYSMCFL